MKSYIITFRADASDAEVKKAKDNIIAQGGTIDHEYTLIKGFSCKLPDNHISTLESNPHIENIEQDQVVTTQ